MSSPVPTCAFRVIGLDDQSLERIEQTLLASVKYRKGRFHKNRDQHVLTLPLDKNNVSASLLKKILSEVNHAVRHDFIISVYSGEETFLIDVPKEVTDLFMHVGGHLCFSFTARPHSAG